MKIVIDARMYGLEHAGIGRYVLNLVKQIEKQDRKNEYFVLLREKYFTELTFDNPRFHKILADYRHYSLMEQLRLPLQLIKLHPDLTHFPHFNAPLFWFGRQVVTIHDLIKHQSTGTATTTRSGSVYWLKFLLYRVLVKITVKKADHLIVPSRYWQDELVRRYDLKRDKISITYEGVDTKYLKPPMPRPARRGRKTSNIKPQTIKKFNINKPFVIYTGSLYPHKNVERLVKAVKLLRTSNFKPQASSITLVVACARNVFYDRFRQKIKEMNAEKFVNLAGFVPDEDLIGLYRQAEAFVFPSLMEGFGLPPLEAMSAGCPVIVSDIPVLKEVCGSAALYFDPSDETDIAAKIKLIVGNSKLKKELIKKGREQVRKYSWTKMAEETRQIYNSLNI